MSSKKKKFMIASNMNIPLVYISGKAIKKGVVKQEIMINLKEKML